jgi:hypothetical protein
MLADKKIIFLSFKAYSRYWATGTAASTACGRLS